MSNDSIEALDEQMQLDLNETNTSTNTNTYSIHVIPSLIDYYTNITSFVALAIFVGALLTLINISIWGSTVSQLRRYLNKPLCGPSIAMVTLYPIISVAALVTLLVPYSWLICHTIMHAMFMIGGPIYRILLFRYVDSEQNFLKLTSGETVQLNTPPFCCCCTCLPNVVPTKTKLWISRYLVYQMPFIQGSVMIILNILYYRDIELYHQVVLFFIPFIIGSIVMGMWSLQVTVRVISKLHGDYQLRKKTFCLQLVVMLCKLQYLLLYEQLNRIPMGGEYPINHTIFKQTIINILILSEMVVVSMMVQSAYRTPIQVQIDEAKAEQTLSRF